MRKLVLLIILLGGFKQYKAQKNLTLYNMRGLPQAVYVNPSFMPKTRVYVSLPLGMQNFSVSNSGFTYNNLTKKDVTGRTVFNTEKLLKTIDKKNVLSLDLQQEIVGVGFKAAGFYFNFNASHRFNFSFTYPKDLIQFALEGNGKNYLGKRVSLDGLGANLISFMEYGLGATKEIGEKLSVGGRIKVLSGITNIHTRRSELGIYTDPTTFDITVDGGAEFNTSNVSGLFADSTRSKTIRSITKNGFNFKNSGLGFDLGASYKLNEDLTLSASIIDLGQITWKSNTKSYIQEDFNFTFRGLDFNQFLSDTTKTPTKAFTDTLQSVFKSTQNTDSYKTGISTKYYLGAFYKITDKINVSALIYSQVLSKTYIPGVTLGFNAAVGKWLTTNFNYSYTKNSWMNLGVGLSIKAGGPFQTYIMTDNMMAFFLPNRSKLAHVCLGMSFYIKDRKLAKKTVDALVPEN